MNKYISCSRCILDTTIEEIVFDSQGVCNYCHTQDAMEKKYPLGEEGDQTVAEIIGRIKRKGRRKKYDCIVGVSGGMDSTYTLYKAVKLGLRPLAVHLDNGWNSDIAVKNINNAARTLNVDLETIVVDWEEFKDLQVAFLKASVSDAEVPTDWVIFSILFKTAKKIGVKYIIHGHSFRTEGSTPLSWTYMDGKYVKSVHRIFGKKKIKSFPIMSMLAFFNYSIFNRIKQIRLLYHISYDEKNVIEMMQNELGWEAYGGKHFESAYTSIFQSYILMKKFNIDKRKLHLSALVRSNQISREEALLKISHDPYVGGERQIAFTVKKLGLTMSEFDDIMSSEVKSYRDYPTYYSLIQKLETPLKFANKLSLVPDSVINKYF